MIGGGGGMIMIMNGAPPPPPPPPGAAAHEPGQRPLELAADADVHELRLGRQFNNTDGAFSMPATGRIADDWGPANFDIRRRFNLGWSSSQLRNFNANLNFNASSAPPYTIRTGVDTNGDLLFNDRPDGVGRNTARGAAQWNMNGFFSYCASSASPCRCPAASTSDRKGAP